MAEKSKGGAGKFFLGAALGAIAGALAGKFINVKKDDGEELEECECDECDCKKEEAEAPVETKKERKEKK